MKKIINGLLYNTETAKLVGTWDNGYNPGDFNYCEESLYRKRTGEYFVYGYGGAMSKYAKWHGNSGGEGEEIRPYTAQEAKEWAEEHLTAEEYIAEFSEPEESDGKASLNLYVSREAKAKLEKMRHETGKSISQIVDEIIKNL